MQQVKQYQEEIARQTTKYLRQQHDNQLALGEQQKRMKPEMEEHRRFLCDKCGLLRAADAAIAQQRQHIDHLVQAVRAHGPEASR